MTGIRRALKGNRALPALVLVIILGAIAGADFMTVGNMLTILRQVSILGIISCGLMFVLLCGHIDLSMGAATSFGSVLFAILVSRDHAYINPVLAMGIVFAVCGAVGLVKAVLVIYCRIPSVIVTLGVSMLLQGVNYLLSDAKIISHLNESVIFLGQGYLGIVPWMVVLFALILACTSFVLRRTYFGRYLYATGSSAKAAHLAGINVEKVEIAAYVICTMLAGFGGIILCCRVKGGQATAGDVYQMNALTACLAGGTSLAGGKGTAFNVLCGVLLIGVFTNVMTMLGFGAYWQDILQSLVLIAAVGLDFRHRNRIDAVGKFRG